MSTRHQRIKDSLLRLAAKQEQVELIGESMQVESSRYEAIRNSEPTKAIVSDNLFQTPPEVASRMAEALGRVESVLEPSAGLGRLVDAVEASRVTMVELSADCCSVLYERYSHKLIQADFLDCDLGRVGGELFDGVIMNPPFRRGADIKHIRHALTMLKPGGRLVGLCLDGVRQNRELKPLVDEWAVLPEKSFRSEGTNVSVAMVVMQR